MLDGILSEGYGISPKALLRNKNISAYAKLVCCYFLSYTGAGKNVCWPTIKTISEDLIISESTVNRSIKELINVGYIEKNKLYKDNPLKTNNIYRLIILENEKDVKDYFNSDTSQKNIDISGRQVDTSEAVTNNNIYNNNIINKESVDKIDSKYIIDNKEAIYNKHKQEELIKYEDNVYLSNKDYNNLISIYNKNTIDNIIIELDNYLTNNPKKKYKDHYKVLRVWLNRDTKKYPKKQIQEKSEFTEITEDQREKSRVAMQKALEKAGFKSTENN